MFKLTLFVKTFNTRALGSSNWLPNFFIMSCATQEPADSGSTYHTPATMWQIWVSYGSPSFSLDSDWSGLGFCAHLGNEPQNRIFLCLCLSLLWFLVWCVSTILGISFLFVCIFIFLYRKATYSGCHFIFSLWNLLVLRTFNKLACWKLWLISSGFDI